MIIIIVTTMIIMILLLPLLMIVTIVIMIITMIIIIVDKRVYGCLRKKQVNLKVILSVAMCIISLSLWGTR